MDFTNEQLSEAFEPGKGLAGFDATDDCEYDEGRALYVS